MPVEGDRTTQLSLDTATLVRDVTKLRRIVDSAFVALEDGQKVFRSDIRAVHNFTKMNGLAQPLVRQIRQIPEHCEFTLHEGRITSLSTEVTAYATPSKAGIDMSALSELSHLTSLHCSLAQPLKELQSISRISTLTYLSLRNTSSLSLEPILQLTNLQTLALSAHTPLRISLSPLKKLESLDIHVDSQSDLTWTRDLAALKVLRLTVDKSQPEGPLLRIMREAGFIMWENGFKDRTLLKFGYLNWRTRGAIGALEKRGVEVELYASQGRGGT